MFQKRPTWTRSRAGRNRVHWVAYDDRADSGDRRIVDQGYAASLVEADIAAKAALAAAGMFQARRSSPGSGLSARPRPEKPAEKASARPEPARPREYVYTRRHSDADDGPLVAAHLVVKKTAKKVYVSRRSCGPDQVGTEDEAWEPDERTIPLDRARLELDGSVFSKSVRDSDFYATREAAAGDSAGPAASFRSLGLRAPASVAEIKAAYRRRAFEVHPDRGGSPDDFRGVEAAYRRLLREAQAAED